MKNLAFFACFCLFFHQNQLPTQKRWPPTTEKWGFFGHRKINRLAVQILPDGLAAFFKPNIDFLTDEATAPDLRRYADPHEAPRHFIDLDVYDGGADLPKTWPEALAASCDFWLVDEKGDSLRLFFSALEERKKARADAILPLSQTENARALRFSQPDWPRFLAYFQKKLMPQFFENQTWAIERDTLAAWLLENPTLEKRAFKKAFAVEKLTEHGILPWHLALVQHRLTEAFREKNKAKVLRLAADLGHYVGDAHVPLHATSNYNGQKTGQTGLHAFWESRVPELFADESWTFWVGKPTYLDDPSTAFWATVFESHRLADSVLTVERQLRKDFPESQQLEPVDRNGQISMQPSRAFAAEFDRRLGHMAERRMRAAVWLTASCWLTAWADAGQPDLTQLPQNQSVMEKETSFLGRFFGQKMLGRGEEN